MREYLEEQAERTERTDPPTLESVGGDVEKYLMISVPPTTEFVHRYLEKYKQKVILVRSKADRARCSGMRTGGETPITCPPDRVSPFGRDKSRRYSLTWGVYI